MLVLMKCTENKNNNEENLNLNFFKNKEFKKEKRKKTKKELEFNLFSVLVEHQKRFTTKQQKPRSF